MRATRLCLTGVVAAAALAASTIAYSAAAISPAQLRAGPGKAWPVKATISAGTMVTVLNCGPGWRNAWCHVRVGGAKGYISSAALAPSGEKNVIIAPVVTTNAANLRGSPSLFSSVKAVIPGGETVNVIRCKTGLGRGWCRVGYENKIGYVRGGLLTRRGAERLQFSR